MTLIIPYGPGGGFEWWAQSIKPFLQKALGAAKIDLVNKPGGGGIVGANYLYHAKPNGLTIGEINGAGSVFAQIAGKAGVQFNVLKYSWLGNPDNEPTITVARAGSPYTSFSDLWKLHGTNNKVRVVSAGFGGNDYVTSSLVLTTLGIPYEMISAYKGSTEAKAGLIRGDGDLGSYGYGSLSSLITGKKVVPIFQDTPTRIPELKNVPTILEVAKQKNLSSAKIDELTAMVNGVGLGKDFVAPPGVSPSRLAFLQKAFKEAATNPKLIAEANKAKRFPGYSTPQALISQVKSVIAHKAQFLPYLVKKK